MYQFQGTAKLFNGRYWQDVPVRVKATNLTAAISRGIRLALKTKRKGQRIEAATITLERLGPVMDLGADEQRGVVSSRSRGANDDGREDTVQD